jgi:uncharacterized membrane protein
VDALRGLAVVFMVPLHTSHGWLRPELRSGNVWSAVQFFGGLAAPIFLSLAGASLGLQWADAQARGRTPQVAKDIARGLQLIVLGYMLRLQMWVIDGAGYAQPPAYLGQLLLLAAYGVAYYAASLIPGRLSRAAAYGLLAILLFAAGVQQVALHVPGRVRNLLRVDVLQCIGASLVTLSCIAGLRRAKFSEARPYLGLALATALLTPWIRSWLPGPLSEPIAGYLGQWPPAAGQPVIGLFPLFPWLAYAFVGCVLGVSWANCPPHKLDARLVGMIALGASLALLTSESWAPIFELMRQRAWLIQPLRVASRIGLVLALLGVAMAATRDAATAATSPLVVFGRASLVVYWVHLEFAFGLAAIPLVRRLDLLGWAVGSVCLLSAMWLLAYLRVIGPRLRVQSRDSGRQLSCTSAKSRTFR